MIKRRIGIEGRIDGEARNVEHVMESARRETGEAIVIVGEGLRDSVRAVSGSVPLSDRHTIKLVILNHHDALAGQELEPGVMGRIMRSLSSASGGKQALADESPAGMKAVDEGGDVGMNQRGRRLGAVVSHIKGEGEVTAMIHVERRETCLGVNGGVVSYLEVGEITGPSGVGCRNAASEKKVAKGGVEAFSETNGLVVGGCRRLQSSTDRRPCGLDDLRDEDATTVGPNAASVTIVAGDAKEVDLEDYKGDGGTLARFDYHTSRKLVRENKGVIVTVIVIADGVEIDSDYVPRMIAVARQMELAGD